VSTKPGQGQNAPRSSSFTILVIDDEQTVLDAAAELLTTVGHRTVTASSGPDGLMCARSEQPDLILIDYLMPVMNGLAVVERLKADPTTSRIPLVAMTAATAELANELTRAGCIGFIPKPFEPTEFRRLVADLLKATVGRTRRGKSSAP
jgi:CheY-like chemotaxis protein